VIKVTGFYEQEASLIPWGELPRAVLVAFQTSHTSDDVWAALRAIQKLTGEKLTGYLGGCHMPIGWDDSQDLYEAIRDSAQEFEESAPATEREPFRNCL